MNCFTFNFKNQLIENHKNQSYKGITKKIYFIHNFILFFFMVFYTVEYIILNDATELIKNQKMIYFNIT